MTKCAPLWRLLLSLFLAIFFGGCSQFKRGDVADEKDPHFLDAKRRQNMKDTNGAIESFERALQSNPNNAAAHLELGLIYEARSNKLASAIHHFEKFVELRTNTTQVPVIFEKINYAKRALATQHGPAFVTRSVQADLEKLYAEKQKYEQRIAQLEAEARIPRYITNYVTNWVTVNEDTQGTRAMTWGTKVVDPPPAATKAAVASIAEEVEPDPAPRNDQKAERSTASTDTKAANGGRRRPNANATSGTAPQRNSSATERDRRSESSSTRARTVHTVRPGDTLDAVARRYGVSAAELRKANPQARKGTVAGQKLVIPQK